MSTKTYVPQDVDSLAMAFGGNVAALMPPYAEIPDEFKEWTGNTWVHFQGEWLFSGLGADAKFHPRDGIDPDKALRHLKAIQASWDPKHEHKMAAVAYLASLWFERVEANGKTFGGAA